MRQIPIQQNVFFLPKNSWKSNSYKFLTDTQGNNNLFVTYEATKKPSLFLFSFP